MSLNEIAKRAGETQAAKGFPSPKTVDELAADPASQALAQSTVVLYAYAQIVEAIRDGLPERYLPAAITLEMERAAAAVHPGGGATAPAVAAKLALTASEIGEQVETLVDTSKGLDDFVEEGIDVIIRELGILYHLGVDIDAALEAKMLVNEARPSLHGRLA